MILKNKRVLITGANGFIGGRLAERLMGEEGARVRAFLRPTVDTLRDPSSSGEWQHQIIFAGPYARFKVDFANVAPMQDVQKVIGDLTDADTVKMVAEDCDIVVHCAARQYRGSIDEFRRVNVGGTLNLLRAAKAAGVSRFIHLSTINVHGYPPPSAANADSPLVFKGDAYSVSKAEGEQVARGFATSYHVPLVVIRPACTYGPGSRAWTLTPLARVRRRGPVLIGGGDGICNAVYIDNLIDLIVLAIKCDDAIGHSFIGAEGRGVTWREFYGAYGQMIGIRRLHSLPRAVARAIAAMSELAASATGQAPFVSRASIEFYSHRVVYDIEKSRRLLGYEPKISFQEGMRRTNEWLTYARLLS